MAAIEPLAIVRLGATDAAHGLMLSTEAGWNQSEADWRFFLTQAVTVGVRADGRLIATAALLRHDAAEAWISMVLVTANRRRQGLATRLVAHCLAAAAEHKLTVSLDATPAGAEVYGRIGFAPTFELRRLRLDREDIGQRRPARAATAPDLQDLFARDRVALGCDRRVLLDALARRAGSRLVVAGNAMALVRAGRTARHVGPLFATDAAEALALCRGIAAEEGSAVLVDAVAAHHDFVAGLVTDGWRMERPFQRMRFGTAAPRPAAPPFAIAGPEYG